MLGTDVFILNFVSEPDDAFRTDDRIKKGAQHLLFPGFDFFSDLDLAFATEKRHQSHFAQIHFHRIRHRAEIRV